jgi:hypothetical protein
MNEGKENGGLRERGLGRRLSGVVFGEKYAW